MCSRYVSPPCESIQRSSLLFREAKADLQKQIPQAVEREAEEIKEELVLENQDTIMAVVKLRVQLEYLLRKLLEKHLTVADASKDIKYMSLLITSVDWPNGGIRRLVALSACEAPRPCR